MKRLFMKLGLSAASLLLAAGAAFAAYPDHAITIIVPFGAGGSNDLPARVFANQLEKRLGQPVVVQNVVGAAGTQGSTQIAQAKPDGYTIGWDPTGALCLQPHMKKLAYGVDSFQFIGMVTMQPPVLLTAKDAPWKDLKEMVEIVKKEPGKYVVGITGKGNMTHIPMLALSKYYGLSFRYAPFRSTPEIMKEMAADRLQFFADMPVALNQYECRGILQFSDKTFDDLKMPNLPDIGLEKSFMMWQAILAPKGLPADVLKILVDATRDVAQSKEYAEGLAKISMKPWWLEPEEAQAFYNKEFEAYGEALKEALEK